MGNELATTGSDWSGRLAYCDRLAESNLLPKQYLRQPANLLWALEYAAALGLSPMAAITGVHVIEGKPSASAALISALVRRAGHRLRVTSNDKEATATIIRRDDPDFAFTATWTMARANAAGLSGKAVWRQYPAAMLAARAITECARNACEEALIGVHYTPEELGADVDEDGVPLPQEPRQRAAVKAEPIDVTPEPVQPAQPLRWEPRDRAAFCATLHGWNLGYEDVAAWCESTKRPRPSGMSQEQRAKLLDYLRTKAGAEKLERWISQQAGLTGPDDEDTAPTTTEAQASGPVCPGCGASVADLDPGAQEWVAANGTCPACPKT